MAFDQLSSALPIKVIRLDHTAVVVRSIEDALPLYRDLLGGTVLRVNEQPQRDMARALLGFPGGSRIEILEPFGGDGFLNDFLQARGEGVHHMTFIVQDIHAAVAQAKAAGRRVVGERFTNPSWMEAFISPRSAHGTVIQLAQASPADQAHPAETEEHIASFLASRRRVRASRTT